MILLLRSTSSFVCRHYGSPRLDLRSFASKVGEIHFFNEQTALPNINEERLLDTLTRIRSKIGYESYAVSLALVEDEEMKETNRETRGIDEPTDILSFPFHEAVEPGLLAKPEFDIPDMKNLGDMMVDVPYVMRRCEEDEEWEYEDDDERGVSGAMVNVFDPEVRLHMLLVHGMLHLVGYDHINDGDYEVMVGKEEELLHELDLLIDHA